MSKAFDKITAGLKDALVHAQHDNWIVEGGVFTDTTFTTLEGPKEFYGPFKTYQEALDAWAAGTWAKVDTCSHRLFIKPRFTGVNFEHISR